ncbi:uncharacterized protein LOC110027485 [Phalaenopsis equestris]|uniref:uncharacterized protein LOC110027485 n=1 Tax=Phalaenopsis equestris TaxID=78828 RepID=UPI0009E3DF03|nr:uncharacterized protein LOC110027485 [Phalaenopsis equestris]
MGNRIGKRRQVVDEKYTRPQGLYLHRDIDHKKLRKLILDCKLAPCYPGSDECIFDQEECPICFLYYPSLNRSRCCLKGICTECFLQMKPPHSSRATQCPYCKTSNYAVEYRGEKTREERGIEQIEEQKVIEAQIRLRHREIQDEHERMKRRQDVSSSSRVAASEEAECHDETNTSLSVSSHACQDQGFGFVSSRSLSTIPVDTRSHIRQHREDHFDMDLEDLMVMEAIWLSIQEQGVQRNPSSTDMQDIHAATKDASPSYGLACTVAALAERQLTDGGDVSSLDACSSSLSTEESLLNNNSSAGWLDTSVHADDGECSVDNSSEVAEAGTSYAGSDATIDAVRAISLREDVNMASSHLLPESFEEQMMLAMAVSLAEARARASPQGVTWM